MVMKIENPERSHEKSAFISHHRRLTAAIAGVPGAAI
jgi:hypothetical protein